MMVEITPVAISNIYYKFYIILAIFNIVIAALVWLLYPETARLTLEEVDFLFASKYDDKHLDSMVEAGPEKNFDEGKLSREQMLP